MGTPILMRQVVREIMPNNMPMVLQGEVSEKGNILLSSIRIIPLTPCMECDELLWLCDHGPKTWKTYYEITKIMRTLKRNGTKNNSAI